MEAGLLRERLGQAAADEVDALERRFGERRAAASAAPAAPAMGTRPDADVLLAGGGLSLLYAVALLQRGFSVAVADPRGVGKGHREWNASLPELRALVDGGIASPDQVANLVVARYRRGIVRWKGGPERSVRGVLDVAVDAQGLLDLLRARALALGATLLDGDAVTGLTSGRGCVRASLVGRDGRERPFVARLVLDGRGAASPLASWDLVCPTVGGVLTGLRDADPTTGDILITIDGARDGAQPIWEGFPGRAGEYTTYLFEYREPAQLGPRPLTALFARFFADLPRYQPGDAKVVRPAFGFIPAYTRLRQRPTAPQDSVLLVGDAAARHSPLTFCGFGSALRSFGKVSARVAGLLEQGRLDARSLQRSWDDVPSLQIQGALALMMLDRGGLHTARDPEAINRVLDAAFGALWDQGEDAVRDFLLDRATPGSVVRMLRGTARARPSIYREALGNLRPRELVSLDLAWWKHTLHL